MGNKKVKEKYNWPMTVLLIFFAAVFILGPLYIAVIIAIKDPSDMINILAWPEKLRLHHIFWFLYRY